ncbi:aldolase [Rhodococcus oxybenzonivorans]|uniref:Aldolase n=1 Tax=Rhodococcus oxybenzonivorans TaxID=1990687 RepID=A0A2S2BQH4_9NOCA|nr:aldolase/citrate lyase family protein [Rhodococcus oxybenzonivorans]AWK70861.1 aldolase [Rhodococcus oxybenzonivorans]
MNPQYLSRLPDSGFDRVDALLGSVDTSLAQHFPGDRPQSQPIHTVYVSAADARPDTPRRWSEQAVALLDRYADALESVGTTGALPDVRTVLQNRPVMDLRIDFEDGYGWRSDDIEDAAALDAGRTLRLLSSDPDGPRFLGIRAKGLAPHERRRGIRTLELVLEGAGGVPNGFVFTVPKLRAAAQVTAVVALCEELERAYGLPDGSLHFELQIESPQAVIGPDGTVTVAKAIHLADGRCTGLHYGTYDYSAACGIASRFQSLEHPVADHAKSVMLVAAAQTGVWVCDGSTQVVPQGSDDDVRAALSRHYRLVTRSLERGYYQGWDMHPGHLITRWLATFDFYRGALPAAATRLQAYLDRQGGGVVDEPATAQALATVVLRGLACGAFDEDVVLAQAPGCTVDVLHNLVARAVVPGT